MQFRKKPVMIEAIQWSGNSNKKEIEDFVGRELKAELESETAYLAGKGAPLFSLLIETKEGVMKVMPNDWVIKEPFPTGDRDFYPCKPDIFANTYDVAAPTGGATPAEENDKKTKEALPHLMALVRVGYSQAALDLAEYCSANNVTPEFQDQVISMLNSGNKRKFSSELFAKELAEVEKELTPPVMEGATAEEMKIKILDREGFDFVAFEFENEFYGKAILKAMDVYATLPGAGVAVTEEDCQPGNHELVLIKGETEWFCWKCKKYEKEIVAGYKAKHQ